MDNIIVEYRYGRGYKVSQMLGSTDARLLVYATKKAASDAAKMGGWKRGDVVKVWGPLFGGWMPACSSVNGDGKQTLVFLSTDFLTYEFVVEVMPIRRPNAESEEAHRG